MAFYDYQFATVDQLLIARDATAAVANDWLGRIVTSVAAANGLGLVTILTNLATKGFARWLIWTLTAAAVFFLVGLSFSTVTLIQFQSRYEVSAHRLQQEMQNQWLRTRAQAAGPEDAENIKRFLEAVGPNQQMFINFLRQSEQLTSILNTVASAMLILGLLITLVAVVLGALKSETAAAALTANAKRKGRSGGLWRRGMPRRF